MYVSMRTTLVIDDSVFRKAKQAAAASGVTLSELTNSALRRLLFGSAEGSRISREKFSMPVFGEKTGVHLTPAQLAELRDEGR